MYVETENYNKYAIQTRNVLQASFNDCFNMDLNMLSIKQPWSMSENLVHFIEVGEFLRCKL